MSETPVGTGYPEEVYARYLYYAEGDLRAAERMLQPPAGFWHEPCFLARECAEKALKAFLSASGREVPELHSLPTLGRACSAVDKAFLRFAGHCNTLATYQHEARYPPADDYPFTEPIAVEAARLASELLDFVRDRIGQRREKGLL